MSHAARRLFGPALLLIILASVIFVFYEGTLDTNYQGEDNLFLSQTARLGAAKSIVTPYKNHFIPLYRLAMRGQSLLSENAIPFRVTILLFHLANVALIFYIVYGRTRSAILSAVAGAAFGLSRQAASVVLFPMNGAWGMSLCFVLLMSIFLDKLIESRSSPSLPAPPETSDAAPAAEKIIEGNEGRSFVPSTRDLTDITLASAEWKMKYYYAALASFVVGLGLFTIAFVGGVVVWAFAYARLLGEGDFRRSLNLQVKVLLPFIMIIGVYLLMRSHFNQLSRPHVDSITRIAMEAHNHVTPARALDLLAGLPPDVYSTAIQRTTPFYEEYYIFAVIALALLLVKEIVVRREEAAVAIMWLGFAALMIAVPAGSRLLLDMSAGGAIENMLLPQYFYAPVAGAAIALGLLLRPPATRR